MAISETLGETLANMTVLHYFRDESSKLSLSNNVSLEFLYGMKPDFPSVNALITFPRLDKL